MAKLTKEKAAPPATTCVLRPRGTKVEKTKSPAKKPAVAAMPKKPVVAKAKKTTVEKGVGKAGAAKPKKPVAAKVKKTAEKGVGKAAKKAKEGVQKDAKTKPVKPAAGKVKPASKTKPAAGKVKPASKTKPGKKPAAAAAAASSKAKASTKVDKTSSKVTKKKKKAPANEDTIAAKVAKPVKDAVTSAKTASNNWIAAAATMMPFDGDAPFGAPFSPAPVVRETEEPKLSKFEEKMAAKAAKRRAAEEEKRRLNSSGGFRFPGGHTGKVTGGPGHPQRSEDDGTWYGEYNPTLQGFKDQYQEVTAGTYQAIKGIFTSKSREASPVKNSPGKAKKTV